MGPWLDYVVSSASTLPPIYHVTVRLSALASNTPNTPNTTNTTNTELNSSVRLVQYLCALCDVPCPGPGAVRKKRDLISVPKSPFKFKKASMDQFWWTYDERVLRVAVRTEKRVKLLMHCLRQARFPATEVKVTLSYPSGVYAASTEEEEGTGRRQDDEVALGGG